MKNILFFLTLLCVTQLSIAQSLSPEIISSSGNSFTNGSSQLDWTMGELSTSTLTNSSNILSQGFHQGNLDITSVDNFDDDYKLSVFPNPAIDFVKILFENKNENNIIELLSIEGKLLLKQSSNFKSLCEINMSNYNSGTYLVKIYNKNTKGKSYRIVKLK